MSYKFNESYNIGTKSIHVMTFLTNSLPLYHNMQGYIGLASCPVGLSDYSFNSQMAKNLNITDLESL